MTPAPLTELRPAALKDVPSVREILVATGAFTEEETACAVELFEAAAKDRSHPDYTALSLATPGPEGRLAGYVLYGRTPFTDATWDLYWIAVAPAHQGDGSARRLMQAAEDDMRAKGARTIMVETAGKPSYARTRAFYERIGYAVIARVPDYYKDGDDLVTYWKRLR